MIQLLLPIAADLIKDHFSKNKVGMKPTIQGEKTEPNQLDFANDLIEKGTDQRPFWKRKTFWTMAVGVLVPIANKVFGWNMDVTEVSVMISPLLLFIATEQWKKK